jgi:hypothetical protein
VGMEFRLAVQSGRVSKHRVGYVIEWKYNSPYIYYQFSIIERAIQIVIDKIRILIIEIQLSIYL